ncbi:butyrophilin subfamily 1 member A1-like [Oryctolagus cuniculus]|uniref:butyrophilin subfamily 1 member A1-like n=1 Tax=Oryctolagus cuniculus TaxID=9986 RepID=UPI0038795D45
MLTTGSKFHRAGHSLPRLLLQAFTVDDGRRRRGWLFWLGGPGGPQGQGLCRGCCTVPALLLLPSPGSPLPPLDEGFWAPSMDPEAGVVALRAGANLGRGFPNFWDLWASEVSGAAEFRDIGGSHSRKQREADDFQVIGPSDPIVAELGGDAILPCYLVPAMNAEDMELRWFRTKFSEAVFVYQNHQEQNREQMPQYAGRTSLVRDLLTQGQAALRIKKVQASDNGMYVCFFKTRSYYEEAILELQVAGLGSAPQVHIEGQEQDGVRVVCKASGWFPKPQVQWTDLSGKKFLKFSAAHAQDAAGLFSVEATLVVRDSSAGSVSCSVLNPILGQEKAMAVSIPEPFFPQASPWKAAFIGSLTVLGLLLFGAGCFTRREHSAKVQEREKQEKLCRAKEEDQRAEEEALKARDELQVDLGWRKTAYLAAWRKAQLYADWRKERFQAWSVTLDPGSAHHCLAISPERKSVTWKHNAEYSLARCTVLGLEGITSGRCYWEVEIRSGEGTQWAVGVCRGHVKKKDWFTESPDTGFWVLRQFYNRYLIWTDPRQALSLRQAPRRVGIFLDYSEGDVSFYNMTEGSHIFSFPPASFSGSLFPYFLLKGDVTLSICSTEGGSEGLPVPLSKSPSLEEAGRPPGEGLSSGSGVDGAPPGAESPLLP